MILEEETVEEEVPDILKMWSNGSGKSNITQGVRLKKGEDKIMASDINELRHQVEQAILPKEENVSTLEGNRRKAGVYIVSVGSDGLPKYGPDGWTTGRNSETWYGRYHIVHNFGTTKYTVQATAYTILNKPSELMINVQEKSKNRVIISIQYANGKDSWADFDALLTLL